MFEVSNLFYYKLIFITELMIAEFIFLNRLRKRSYYVLRLLGSVALNYLFTFLIPIPQWGYNALYSSAMFILIFFFTVVTAKFCYVERYVNLLFCCLAGYGTQHITYELYNFVLVLFDFNPAGGNIYSSQTGDFIRTFFPNALVLVCYIAIYFSVYSLIFFLFGNKIKNNEQMQLKNLSLFAVATLIIFVDIVLNAIIVYHYSDVDKVLKLILGIYNMTCCALALFMQFELSLRKQLENELEIVKQLRYKEQEQYRISKENIELINIKCHDFKHQLASLGVQNKIPDDYIAEAQEVISIYDSEPDTGNMALNVVIGEKNLRCGKNHIRLTGIIDGVRLGFMSEGDVYSLFGNLLDNAIEAVLPLEESKRSIGLQVVGSEREVLIDVYNSFEGKRNISGGLPETTKDNVRYHGFGLKSIKYVVEKYGGTMSIFLQNHIFEVKINLPVP